MTFTKAGKIFIIFSFIIHNVFDTFFTFILGMTAFALTIILLFQADKNEAKKR